jgi:hypothetical protein
VRGGATGLPLGPAVAVGGALGDDVCVTDDTSGEPFSPRPVELLNYLRQIANHPDAPDTVQADARDYLEYLEAASSGSGGLTRRLPRPRFGAS